jgi:hypothetical protein
MRERNGASSVNVRVSPRRASASGRPSVWHRIGVGTWRTKGGIGAPSGSSTKPSQSSPAPVAGGVGGSFSGLAIGEPPGRRRRRARAARAPPCCSNRRLPQSTPSTGPPIRATAWASRNARTGPKTFTRRARRERPAKIRTRSPSISTSIGSHCQPGRARSSRAWTSGSRKLRTRSCPPLRASTSWARAAHTEHPLSYNSYRFGMGLPSIGITPPRPAEVGASGRGLHPHDLRPS